MLKFVSAFFLLHSVCALRGSTPRFRRKTSSDLKSDIAKSLEIAKDNLELIYYRYQMDEHIGYVFRRISYNMDENSFELMKYQFAKKIVSDQATYLATFGGSSVTAGHDNLYNESYPEVFGRRVGPAMEAVGIKFDVHNIAQGANACFPSNGCYESMGGFNPDFINWEQSFNCGHSVDMFELAARAALWSQNPGLVYYTQSGSLPMGTGCNKSSYDPPYSNEHWTPKTVGKAPYRASWDDVKALKADLIKSYNELGAAAARFGGAALTYKKQGAPLAVSGMSLWEERKAVECEGLDFMIPNKCNLGPFYGGCKGMQISREFEASRYGNGRGAAHHPTTAGHLYRGENIAYVVLLPFMDALYEVQKDLEAGADKASLFKKYNDHYESLYTLKTMPPPVYCPKDNNDKALYSCESRMQCFTDYHPHYAANLSLSGLIVGTTKWETNYPDYKGWGIPDQTHLELRPGWSATKGPDSGEIHFKINMGRHGRLTIVGYHYPNALSANEFLLELDVPDDRLKNYTPDVDKWHIWTDVRTDPKNGWAMLTNIPAGQHVMSVRSKVNEKSVAGISHIMMNADGFY